MLYWNFWTSFLTHWAQQQAQLSAPRQAPAQPVGASGTDSKDYLAEYGKQILCLVTAGKGCTHLSANFETITGFSCDDFLGERFFDLLHEDFQARLQEVLSAPIPRGKPFTFRCKIKHADGSHYWYVFQIHSKPQGSLGEFVCIMENVHDSILIQNNLQKAKLEAELALRARSEFLANMSHDLRTPLNAVIGFAQIIENEIFGKIENPQYREYIKHIQESGHDLLSKIEDLLEIANIDAGRVSLEREEVYLSDILKHVVEAQFHHASPNRITIEYLPVIGDMLLNVDRVKLQHILGHLVSNAIKFSQPGGRIVLEVTGDRWNGLTLSVRDFGAGMTSSKLTQVQHALEQDDCWAAKNNHYIGLGFALAKEFVSLHGGDIKVESKPGEGTCVHIFLPKDCIRDASVKELEFAQAK